MDVERLVTMANDIAAFFASEPSHDAAAEQVANHLRRFWEPRMRASIREHLARGGAGLSEIARSGIERL